MEQENKNYYKFTIITTKKRQNCSMNIEKNGEVSQNYNIISTKKENYFEIQCTSKKKTNYLVFFDQISHGRHSFSKKNPMKIKNTAEEVFFRITENFLEEG